MNRRPPRSTRTDTLFPYTTLFRSHGNELCGAIALDWLFRHGVKPLRGKLSLAFMNIAAYRNFDPANPTASRFVDEDFNRLWTAAVLDDPARQSAELTRARLLRLYIDTVDLLLDIPSMQRNQPAMMMGSEERRVGKECASPCRTR